MQDFPLGEASFSFGTQIASPKGCSGASSFPAPEYEGHWHGQLERKTAPLAHERLNHGHTLFSIRKHGGDLVEVKHTLCAACICGLKIIKLFPYCAAQNSFLESISVLWEAAG